VRLLQRTSEPTALQTHGPRWTAEFLQSVKGRPDSSKYAHPDVVTSLRAMSHNKCFYCERPFATQKPQVDHYIEVSCDRSLAFVWGNLYLSCSTCNYGKPDNHQIPVSQCLDPCGSVPVEDHLEFVGDHVRPKKLSPTGERTIRKYKLLDEALKYQRLQVLSQLAGDYEAILARRLTPDGPRSLDDNELARLRAYAAPTEPFSACCRAWLEARGLW